MPKLAQPKATGILPLDSIDAARVRPMPPRFIISVGSRRRHTTADSLIVAAGMDTRSPRANAWIQKKPLEIGLEGNQFFG
jgi:hypothetical protein